MEKIKITVDSACDCAPEILKENNIGVIPFYVLMDGKDRLDGVEVSGKDVVEYVEKTDILPRTSAPSMEAYESFFNEMLQDNDYILHFCISSEFSVACSNAVKVAEKFKGKVKVVDTRSLSTGISLVMLNAIDLLKEGKSIEEVASISKKVAKCTQSSFTLESLRMLHKGGRCSGLAAFMGKAFGLKPSLLVRGGKLGANKKYMLQKFDVTVKRYVLDTLKQFPNIDKKRCFVTHTPTDAHIVEMVKDIAKDYFDEVIESDAGATICSHCGRNTIGLLYVCKDEI